MDEGTLYVLTAFGVVWVVVLGYLAYLTRRARWARQGVRDHTGTMLRGELPVE